MPKVISCGVLALVFLAIGCAAKPKPVAVAEGEVTIDGEAVDGGIISFIHAESEASAGGAAIAGCSSLRRAARSACASNTRSGAIATVRTDAAQARTAIAAST